MTQIAANRLSIHLIFTIVSKQIYKPTHTRFGHRLVLIEGLIWVNLFPNWSEIKHMSSYNLIFFIFVNAFIGTQTTS